MTYQFFPFFLECSIKETDTIKKRHLERLDFGKAGVFRESVYVTENGDFKIPKVYSDEERDKLYKLVWSGDTEFSRMEKKIKERLSTWSNLKKRDKLRMIDKYALSLDCDFEEKKKISGKLKTKILIKLLNPKDIEYENFKILRILENVNVCVDTNRLKYLIRHLSKMGSMVFELTREQDPYGVIVDHSQSPEIQILKSG